MSMISQGVDLTNVGKSDAVGMENDSFIDQTTKHHEKIESSENLSHSEEQFECDFECEENTMSEETIKPALPTVEEFFANHDAGEVDLAFPESLEYESSPECYPKSYYTLSGKERLLLLFAENFRKQFNALYPERRPLLLAAINECNVQKFVCTTIRPTAFLYPSLIASLEGCASFVADFIEYKPLENPKALPPILVSPATLLRRRQGNSFEMATLLCSMLIGAGYPAMVVSGSARLETVNNDQRNVKYPLPDDSMDNYKKVDAEKLEVNDRYRLRPLPDLESHLTEKLEKIKFEREAQEKAEQEEVARVARETLEDEVLFNDPYRLSHAWVMIVHNAPWSTKQRIKIVNEEGDEVVAPPSVTFIEPSTGFEHNTSTKAYIHIESVWNNLNYYVNLQKCRIREMNWDLRNTNEWEHFLVGEPPEMQMPKEVSDENLAEEANKFKIEKHLDMSRSWVEKLQIGEREMDERFPNLHKAVLYHRVLHERFSPHSQVDGKVEQLTFYSDDNYNEPEIRWNWYKNRSDLMARVKFAFASGQTDEFFLKGRPDALKYLLYNVDQSKSKIMQFFSAPRPDSLQYAEVHKDRIVLEFEKSPGSCYHKEFISKQGMTKLREITEKFKRDPSKPALDDIATRSFLLEENKIVLKFHYLKGALTAATREFIKPPRPDYGHEIIFNPSLTKGFRFGVSDPEPTQRELYTMLLEQLNAGDSAKKEFYKRVEELNRIFELRQTERKHTVLKFRAFDSLRNTAARKNRLEQEEQEKKVKKERRENQPDFLAPYLVPYVGRTLTQKESWDAYNACLTDLKSRFVSLLNELQRRYEDLTAESQSLKKFLNKFENKFDDFDYERMLQESKDLELNKRMVQKRLTITHEEAQKKYDMVKQSLLKDKRLCLRNPPTE